MPRKSIKPGSYILQPNCIDHYIHNMQVMAQDCINCDRCDPFNSGPETPGTCHPLHGCSFYCIIFGQGTDNELRTEFILAGSDTSDPASIAWWEISPEVQATFLLFYIEYLKSSYSPAERSSITFLSSSSC